MVSSRGGRAVSWPEGRSILLPWHRVLTDRFILKTGMPAHLTSELMEQITTRRDVHWIWILQYKVLPTFEHLKKKA